MYETINLRVTYNGLFPVCHYEMRMFYDQEKDILLVKLSNNTLAEISKIPFKYVTSLTGVPHECSIMEEPEKMFLSVALQNNDRLIFQRVELEHSEKWYCISTDRWMNWNSIVSTFFGPFHSSESVEELKYV